MTEPTPEQLDASKQRLIDALDVFRPRVDPCEHGHVAHTEEDHLGRPIVHTVADGFGADWDYDSAVQFIRTAVLTRKTEGWVASTGHGGAAQSPNGRWVAFATKAPK